MTGMPDREKIESLKQCLSASCRGFRTCPYSTKEWDAIETVLELLAEQEPVKPETIVRTGIREEPTIQALVCGNCHKIMGYCVVYNFCPWCGRAVKWDAL